MKAYRRKRLKRWRRNRRLTKKMAIISSSKWRHQCISERRRRKSVSNNAGNENLLMASKAKMAKAKISCGENQRERNISTLISGQCRQLMASM